MKKREIGQSQIKVSELTLGCMSLPVDIKKAKNIIDKALDYGINHLDTADLYDFGENEKIVGEIIKDRRNDLILTSKVGNHFNREEGTWFWDPSPEHIEASLADSLKRLGTDYLDFYLLHGGTIEDPIDDVIETFERLKEKGHIRAYGISSIRPNVINEYIKRSNIDAIMMQYNMLDRRPEEYFSLINDAQVSVLARGPFAKGILTDSAKAVVSRKGKDGYLTYDEASLKHVVDRLLEVTDGKLSAASLAYILNESVIGTAVFGASSEEQIDEIVQAYQFASHKELIKEIKEITDPISY